uniref:Reverse transcriptase zinc-binding domain-containing protein n=1 Tax=Chenopodium quinoa TaxID=63459 RepID=A0A803MDK2_CHEQI
MEFSVSQACQRHFIRLSVRSRLLPSSGGVGCLAVFGLPPLIVSAPAPVAGFVHPNHQFAIWSSTDDSSCRRCAVSVSGVLLSLVFRSLLNPIHPNQWSDSGIKIPTVNVESPADLCVAELIDHKRHCWDVEALHQHLIAEDIAIVQGLLLSLNNVSNSMYWSPATDGMYSTTKSSYWLARMGHVSGWTERFRGDRAAIWNAIWNNGGPPKLCQFLWRACTKSLATLGRLRQRHVRDNGVCGVFHNSQESIVHAIFLCPNNRDVRVLGFLRLVKDYKKYNNVVRVSSPTAVARNEWKPPSAVFIRINSDAAVINENNASIGMVLRDEQGVMVAAKVKRIAGMPSIKVLEAMAARMGL